MKPRPSPRTPSSSPSPPPPNSGSPLPSGSRPTFPLAPLSAIPLTLAGRRAISLSTADSTTSSTGGLNALGSASQKTGRKRAATLTTPSSAHEAYDSPLALQNLLSSIDDDDPVLTQVINLTVSAVTPDARSAISGAENVSTDGISSLNPGRSSLSKSTSLASTLSENVDETGSVGKNLSRRVSTITELDETAGNGKTDGNTSDQDSQNPILAASQQTLARSAKCKEYFEKKYKLIDTCVAQFIKPSSSLNDLRAQKSQSTRLQSSTSTTNKASLSRSNSDSHKSSRGLSSFFHTRSSRHPGQPHSSLKPGYNPLEVIRWRRTMWQRAVKSGQVEEIRKWKPRGFAWSIGIGEFEAWVHEKVDEAGKPPAEEQENSSSATPGTNLMHALENGGNSLSIAGMPSDPKPPAMKEKLQGSVLLQERANSVASSVGTLPHSFSTTGATTANASQQGAEPDSRQRKEEHTTPEPMAIPSTHEQRSKQIFSPDDILTPASLLLSSPSATSPTSSPVFNPPTATTKRADLNSLHASSTATVISPNPAGAAPNASSPAPVGGSLMSSTSTALTVPKQEESVSLFEQFLSGGDDRQAFKERVRRPRSSGSREMKGRDDRYSPAMETNEQVDRNNLSIIVMNEEEAGKLAPNAGVSQGKFRRRDKVDAKLASDVSTTENETDGEPNERVIDELLGKSASEKRRKFKKKNKPSRASQDSPTSSFSPSSNAISPAQQPQSPSFFGELPKAIPPHMSPTHRPAFAKHRRAISAFDALSPVPLNTVPKRRLLKHARRGSMGSLNLATISPASGESPFTEDDEASKASKQDDAITPEELELVSRVAEVSERMDKSLEKEGLSQSRMNVMIDSIKIVFEEHMYIASETEQGVVYKKAIEADNDGQVVDIVNSITTVMNELEIRIATTNTTANEKDEQIQAIWKRVDRLTETLNASYLQRLRHIEDAMQEVASARKRRSIPYQIQEFGFSVLAYTLTVLGSVIWFGFQVVKVVRFWTRQIPGRRVVEPRRVGD